MGAGRVVMGLLFYPRGGSAYVVRYLSPALERAGWQVSLATGSLGQIGVSTNAATFFAGLDVHPLDATAAVEAFERGEDAIAQPQPMHPSYEDREGVPDVVFASVAPELADHLAAVWEAPMRAAGAADADVLHLHHLTPQLDAACRYWPDVPRVVHLHGTELKLIEGITVRAALAGQLGETLATMADADAATLDGLAAKLDTDEERALLHGTRWPAWRHGEFWADHLKTQAHRADHLVTVSPQNRDAAIEVLGFAPDDVTALPNGVDIDRFHPRERDHGARRAAFRRYLVDDPQGWAPGAGPGSVRYTEADLDRLLGPDDDATVLLLVGRFLGFKRMPALVRAFADARDRFARPASLVVWGGHPGEWEGEHPVAVAEEVGADGIFFTGWRGHDDLPEGLAMSDVLVVPSVADPYPQVPLEAMAVGLPVLACESGGLTSMVNLDPQRPTGWFVPPDDSAAMTEALVAVVNDPAEVRRRGAHALEHARTDLSWDGLVPRFEAVYAEGITRARERVRRAGGGT
jgi:glycosyltransferase involved in cell wall biosynthesis